MNIKAAILKYPMVFWCIWGAVAFIPFLGAAPLFDWDEINFAESAREMIVTGNYFQVQINYEPFWEKPPLFIWLQALSMHVFGINEFAARLPNALIGIATLLFLFRFAGRLRGERFAWLVTGLYFISFLPHLYFKSGIIDPLFNLFIFSGLLSIFQFEQAWMQQSASQNKYLWIAALLVGLATLTKGPVALLLTLLTYVIYKAVMRTRVPWLPILGYAGIYLLVILSWFGALVLFTPEGFATVEKFIVYQVELFMQPVAGHEQPPYYHLLVFLIGCFPLSAFAFQGMFLKQNDEKTRAFQRMMVILFWVVMVLFTIVRTKIIHYSSLTYFPAVMLASLYLERLWEGEKRIHWSSVAVYAVGFLLLAVGAMAVGFVAGHVEWVEPYVKGKFAQAAIQMPVQWSGLEFIPGLVYFIATAAGLYFLLKRKTAYFLATMVLALPIFANGINAMILPRIADYTQNAAVRFLKEVSKEDAYIMLEGNKSYAHYFYGQMKPFPHPEIPAEKRGDWMARQNVDKPVYLVARIDKVTDEFERVWFEKFKRIRQEGGFIFYKRELPEASPKSPNE